ncbi:MAG: hypothetical protein IPJ82_09330 [Lewinellaceae bacterium]|nr:hypothetical protein [Lewinellaceae bacterium]
MKYFALSGAALLLALTYCTSPNASSPEEVARQWQAYIDKNEFEEARQLSAGEALRYVEDLANYNEQDTLEWENNVMLNLRCQVLGDSVYCTYHFEDELGEPIPGQLALKRIDGRWLVWRTFFDTPVPVDSLDTGEDLLFKNDTLNDVLE